MQMNRWFGYRGQHVEFCRVFTLPSGFMALKEVAENDLALRGQLSALMTEKKAPADATLIFVASPYSQPTAKMGAGVRHDLSFSPFTKVLSTVELGALADANQTWAMESLGDSRRGLVVYRSSGIARVPLGELVGSGSGRHSRRLVVRTTQSFGVSGLIDAHYRRPDPTRPVQRRMIGQNDPYQVAAYLRYWSAQGGAPTFNVGFAFGELDRETSPFDVNLLNREVTPDGVVIGGWTGRSSNWRGDTNFDGVTPALMSEPNLRRHGAAGLLLFYVVHKDAKGQNGRGCTRKAHTPFVGIAIPDAGPHFVRYLVGPEAGDVDD